MSRHLLLGRFVIDRWCVHDGWRRRARRLFGRCFRQQRQRCGGIRFGQLLQRNGWYVSRPGDDSVTDGSRRRHCTRRGAAAREADQCTHAVGQDAGERERKHEHIDEPCRYTHATSSHAARREHRVLHATIGVQQRCVRNAIIRRHERGLCTVRMFTLVRQALDVPVGVVCPAEQQQFRIAACKHVESVRRTGDHERRTVDPCAVAQPGARLRQVMHAGSSVPCVPGVQQSAFGASTCDMNGPVRLDRCGDRRYGPQTAALFVSCRGTQIAGAPSASLGPAEQQQRSVLRPTDRGHGTTALVGEQDRIICNQEAFPVAGARRDVFGSPATACSPARVHQLAAARPRDDMHGVAQPDTGGRSNACRARQQPRVHVLCFPCRQPPAMEVHQATRPAREQRDPATLTRNAARSAVEPAVRARVGDATRTPAEARTSPAIDQLALRCPQHRATAADERRLLDVASIEDVHVDVLGRILTGAPAANVDEAPVAMKPDCLEGVVRGAAVYGKQLTDPLVLVAGPLHRYRSGLRSIVRDAEEASHRGLHGKARIEAPVGACMENEPDVVVAGT